MRSSTAGARRDERADAHLTDPRLRAWMLATALVGTVSFAVGWISDGGAPATILGTFGLLAFAGFAFARRWSALGILALAGSLALGWLGSAPLAGLALAAVTAAVVGAGWSNARAAAWALACGPLAVLVALDRPGSSLALTFPLAVVLCTLGAARLQRAIGRARYPGRGSSAPASASSGRGATLLAALVWLALILPIGAVLAGLAELLDLDPDTRAREAARELERETIAQEEATGPTRQLDGRFPSALRLTGQVESVETEAVLVARPLGSDRSEHEPLYLRGLVLERFDAERGHFAASTELLARRDADDEPDGWTTLRAPAADAQLELEIEQQSLQAGDASILFVPAGATALSVPEVRWHPDVRTELPDAPPDGVGYRVRYEASDPPADRPSAERVALPTGGAAIAELHERAAEICGARDDPRAQVARITARFQGEYDYAVVSTREPGLEGVLDFLDKKRGHCTYFATATALLLRARGVPARVATGFLASDWSAADEAFIVTTKNGHAWTEVWLDGRWERVDTTPLDRRRAWLERIDGQAEPGLGEWLADMAFDLALWVRTRGEEPGLGALMSTLGEGPAALGRSLRASPFVATIAGALALWLAWRWLRRRRPARPSALGPPPIERSLRARFARTLSRVGPRRRPSQTLLELARSVGQAHPSLAEAPAHATALDRARWSGTALSDAERDVIRTWLRTASRGGSAD